MFRATYLRDMRSLGRTVHPDGGEATKVRIREQASVLGANFVRLLNQRNEVVWEEAIHG